MAEKKRDQTGERNKETGREKQQRGEQGGHERSGGDGMEERDRS